MKIVLKIILFLLPTCGVFSADTTMSMSVMEGQSVTLTVNPNTPDYKKINRLIWRFLGNGNSQIAKISGNEITYPPDDTEMFRGRLKLDNQTGSLTIMNVKTSDAGLYKAEISRNNLNKYLFFEVTVSVPGSGLSPGAAAGIAVVVVLLVFAGAAAFVFYHRLQLPDRKPTHEEDVMLVSEGSHVTLNPDTEIQKGDLILWMFGDDDCQTQIGKIKKTKETYDGPNARFKNRLNLDKKTGSLTIKDIKNNHTGQYKLQISNSSRPTTNKTFKVLVN